MCSIADIFSEFFLQLRMKFNTKTMEKHIVPILPEIATRIEIRVWRQPEGTKRVSHFFQKLQQEQ